RLGERRHQRVGQRRRERERAGGGGGADLGVGLRGRLGLLHLGRVGRAARLEQAGGGRERRLVVRLQAQVGRVRRDRLAVLLVGLVGARQLQPRDGVLG